MPRVPGESPLGRCVLMIFVVALGCVFVALGCDVLVFALVCGVLFFVAVGCFELRWVMCFKFVVPQVPWRVGRKFWDIGAKLFLLAWDINGSRMEARGAIHAETQAF